MNARQTLLAAATVLSGLAFGSPGWAANPSLTSPRLPPDPTPDLVEQAVPDLANPLNKPITGAQVDPLVTGTRAPPSLEALQATRPGDETGDG